MFSYSGLTSYGKATLPSVEGWSTSSNIIKDPPKSIHTRKVDKVGETSYLNTVLGESNDRFCEAINYYARGTNPMVSVNYGQGQNSKTNAYLPYRVARDGAFRPPILRQEDLIPLSRLPRIWTTITAQPYNINYSLRPIDIGNAETTREVKTHLMTTSCEANKNVYTDPEIVEPEISSAHIIYDPLVPGELKAACNQYQNSSYQQQVEMQKPILLSPSRPTTSGYTVPFQIVEKPVVFNNIKFKPNHPTTSIQTNRIYNFDSSRINEITFDRLPEKIQPGSFTNSLSIPSSEIDHVLPKLVRVR